MTGFGSPCGACKFLRRKCLRGCIFAPYFCHEEGPTQFAAIHKVFGASNFSKLLAHLPVPDRCEAAASAAYEALARLQDPIYGCVSQILALQKQVVNLQAQLAFLKGETSQSIANGCSTTTSTSQGHKPFQNLTSYSDVQQQFHPNPNMYADSSYNVNALMDPNHLVDYQHTAITPDENETFNTFQDSSIPSHDMHTSKEEWRALDAEDLESVAFPYLQYSS